MTSTLAPFCKVRIPGTGSTNQDATPPCYRMISTNDILNVDGSPSLEMLSNVVTVLLQEKQAPALLGLRYFDEEGDLVKLLTDEGLEEALTMCPTKLKIECVLKQAALEVSLYGRDHASVLLDYSQILKSTPVTHTKTPNSRRAAASYWKLLQVATEAFNIPRDYSPPMLLRVSIDGSKTEITNDMDLSAHLERVEHTGWVEPVQIEIVGSYLTIAEEDKDMEEIPLTKFLNSMGEISFSKLLKHCRRKNPHKPIKSFLYLDSNASKQIISNGRELVHAMHNQSTNGLTIHPHYQNTDLMLNPEQAVVSGTCELGNDPLRPVLLNAPDSMAMWDVSHLVPGRYKAKARYFRSKSGGAVSLYTGKMQLPTEENAIDRSIDPSFGCHEDINMTDPPPDSSLNLIPPELKRVSVYDGSSSPTKRTVVSLLQVPNLHKSNHHPDASIPLLFSTTRLLERLHIPLPVSDTPTSLWISSSTQPSPWSTPPNKSAGRSEDEEELQSQLDEKLTLDDNDTERNEPDSDASLEDDASIQIPDARSFDEPPTSSSIPTTPAKAAATTQETEKAETSSTKESSSLPSLPRVDNAAEMMRTALADIYLFQHRIRGGAAGSSQNKKEHPSNQEQSQPHQKQASRRLQALTSARDRLQQQQQQLEEKKDSSPGEAAENDGKDKDSSDHEHDKDNDEKEEEEDDDQDIGDDPHDASFRDPWMRIIRTVNSLAVLTPLALHMLFHPQRNNQELTIGKVSLKTNNKNKRRGGPDKCWLILDGRGFDVTSQKSAKGLYNLLRNIFLAMGSFVRPPSTSIQQQHASFNLDKDMAFFERHWQTAIDQLLETLLNVSDNQGYCEPTTPQHPLSSICHANGGLTIEQAESITHKLDEAWGLQEETLSPAEVKRQANYEKAIANLQKRVFGLLRNRFRRQNDDDDIQLSVYGSCLSNLSLGRNSDVDMSLYLRSVSHNLQAFEAGELNASKYDKERRNTVYKICRALEQGPGRDQFSNMQPIAHARVPVVRGCYKAGQNPFHPQGHMDFDICLCNDVAVVNSSLIREYCLVDHRVKMLCKAVKQWAKAQKISSAADGTLSSYAWTNMVLVYLAFLQLIPNLQSRELAKQAGVTIKENDPWHSIKNLDTFYLKWSQVQHVWQPPANMENVSVTALLFGFFEFYGTNSIQSSLFVLGLNTNEPQSSQAPQKDNPAPRVIPRTVFRRCSWFWTIQDPFETFDSHCPHDLASHAEKDKAILMIRWYLHEAYQTLHDCIMEARVSGGQSQAFEQWPSAVLSSSDDIDQRTNTGQSKKSNSTPIKSNNQQKQGSDTSKPTRGRKRNSRRKPNHPQKQASPQKESNHSKGNSKATPKKSVNDSSITPTPKKQPNSKAQVSPSTGNSQTKGASAQNQSINDNGTSDNKQAKSPPKRNNRNQKRFANKITNQGHKSKFHVGISQTIATVETRIDGG